MTCVETTPTTISEELTWKKSPTSTSEENLTEVTSRLELIGPTSIAIQQDRAQEINNDTYVHIYNKIGQQDIHVSCSVKISPKV